MVILGIDPGLATVGYGVIDAQGSRLSLIDYGTIDTPAQMPLPRRLRIIHEGMGQLLEE